MREAGRLGEVHKAPNQSVKPTATNRKRFISFCKRAGFASAGNSLLADMQQAPALRADRKEELKAFALNKSCIHHVPKRGLRPMPARQGRERIMSSGHPKTHVQAGAPAGSAAHPGNPGTVPGKDATGNQQTVQNSPPPEGSAPNQPPVSHISHISHISREGAERNLTPDSDPDDPVSP